MSDTELVTTGDDVEMADDENGDAQDEYQTGSRDAMTELLESIDHYLPQSRLPFSSYAKRFTRKYGNVHSGSVRLNVELGEDDKVNLVPRTECHCQGAQGYDDTIRTNCMEPTRPNRAVVQTGVPHGVNVCTNGRYLNSTLNDSMMKVSESLQFMTEIYAHSDSRTGRQESPSMRTELFLSFYNLGTEIQSLPIFDPTYHLDLFNKELIDEFEKEMVTIHFDPIKEIFGELAPLAWSNRMLNMSSLSAEVRTRIAASLEILVSYSDDKWGTSGTIQRKIAECHCDIMGITMDIPHGLRVPLSRQEMEMTGFQYGVRPDLLPMVSRNRSGVPPNNLAEITATTRHGFFSFPAFFSSVDRSVACSLSPKVNMGMLEGVKSEIQLLVLRAMAESHPRFQEGNPPPEMGVMDGLDLFPLLTSSEEIRWNLFKRISRLLITCICHIMWQEFVQSKVFGDEPDFVSAHAELGMDDNMDDNYVCFSKSFEHFPFDNEAMDLYVNYLDGCKFVKKDNIAGQGKVIMLPAINNERPLPESHYFSILFFFTKR
jgi:hypothetical protein